MAKPCQSLGLTFGKLRSVEDICDRFDRKSMKKIAVLTSGGDAPGMNAAIRAVVRTSVFHDMEVVGVFQGYQGLIDGDFKRLHVRSVAKILGRGGTILKSARCQDFMSREGRKRAHVNLVEAGVDGLGGDWRQRHLHRGHEVGRETGVPVVGLPGTIDNDLCGSDCTIGFDTAINTVIDAVDKIRDTADSHNRLFFVEVMGRDSGFIALKAGIATGAVAVMTPELGMSIDDLVAVLQAGEQSNKTSSIVLVAEGDPNGGALRDCQKGQGKNPTLRDPHHRAWVTCSAAGRRPVSIGCSPPAWVWRLSRPCARAQ